MDIVQARRFQGLESGNGDPVTRGQRSGNGREW